VVIGRIDSIEIGELSNPIISYSSGIFFLFFIKINSCFYIINTIFFYMHI
jgi:hypothetical protein